MAEEPGGSGGMKVDSFKADLPSAMKALDLDDDEMVTMISVEDREEVSCSARVLRVILRRILVKLLESTDPAVSTIGKLLNCKGFILFLLTALKSENSLIHKDALSLLNFLVGSGSPAQGEKLVGCGIFPAVVTLLAATEDGLTHRIALPPLYHISTAEFGAKEFENSETIIPTLSILARKTEVPEVFHIIAVFTTTWCRNVKSASPSSKRHLLDLLVNLMKGGGEIEKVVHTVCTCLCFILKEGWTSYQEIIQAGFVPYLIPLLSHPNLAFVEGATLAIFGIAEGGANSMQRMLDFFKGIGGAKGMKDFHRTIYSVKEDTSKANMLICFLNTLVFAVEGSLRSEMIGEVISSGFIFSLVKFLDPVTPANFQIIALIILKKMTLDIDATRAEGVVRAGAIQQLVNQLETKDSKLFSLAITSLRNLLPVSVQYRRDFVKCGGLPKLFRCIRLFKKKTQLVTDILIEFELFLEMQEPRLEVKLIKRLPECLKLILDPVNVKRLKKEDLAGAEFIQRKVKDCAKLILKYGEEGVEMVRGSRLMSDAEINSFLNPA